MTMFGQENVETEERVREIKEVTPYGDSRLVITFTTGLYNVDTDELHDHSGSGTRAVVIPASMIPSATTMEGTIDLRKHLRNLLSD